MIIRSLRERNNQILYVACSQGDLGLVFTLNKVNHVVPTVYGCGVQIHTPHKLQ